MCAPLPTECVSPRIPSGASSFMCPRRIFSSFGNGGKKSGGGGWPGARSGMFGGADVNADRLCAYARSSGYGIAAGEYEAQTRVSMHHGRGERTRRTRLGLLDGLYAFLALAHDRIELASAFIQLAHDLAPPAVERKHLVLQLLDPPLLHLVYSRELHGGSELCIDRDQLRDRRTGWRSALRGPEREEEGLRQCLEATERLEEDLRHGIWRR